MRVHNVAQCCRGGRMLNRHMFMHADMRRHICCGWRMHAFCTCSQSLMRRIFLAKFMMQKEESKEHKTKLV